MLDVLTIMAQTFHWPIYWPERFTGHSNEAFPQRHHFSGRRPPMPPMRKPEAVASFRPNFRGDRILGGSEVVLPPSKRRNLPPEPSPGTYRKVMKWCLQ